MRNPKKLIISLLMISFIIINVTVAVFAAAPVQQDSQTIVDIVAADGRFATLVTALTEAELVDTLNAEGPFTIFAPTDEAFAALPEGVLDGLLADKAALADVLRYHVVPGQIMAADVVNLASAETALGEPLSITVDGENVMINDANVIITDIEGSNGVIHVIDKVLLPPADEAPAGEAATDEASSDEAAEEPTGDIAEEPAALPQTGGDTPAGTNHIVIISVLGVVLVAGGLVLRFRSTR